MSGTPDATQPSVGELLAIYASKISGQNETDMQLSRLMVDVVVKVSGEFCEFRTETMRTLIGMLTRIQTLEDEIVDLRGRIKTKP